MSTPPDRESYVQSCVDLDTSARMVALQDRHMLRLPLLINLSAVQARAVEAAIADAAAGAADSEEAVARRKAALRAAARACVHDFETFMDERIREETGDQGKRFTLSRLERDMCVELIQSMLELGVFFLHGGGLQRYYGRLYDDQYGDRPSEEGA